MNVRVEIPGELLRDPEIQRRVRDFRHEERLRHALAAGALALAALACLTRGAPLWIAGVGYALAALWWTVRLERMLARGMYESFHALECAVWARVGRLPPREHDADVLRTFIAAHGLSERLTLAELYEVARERRHDRGPDADKEFRAVADAVYRFLVAHRFAATDAVLVDMAPRAVLFAAAVVLVAGGAAALLAAGGLAPSERVVALAAGGYLLLLARALDAGRPWALAQAYAVAGAAAAWAMASGSAALLAPPLAFAGLLWYGRRALDRE